MILFISQHVVDKTSEDNLGHISDKTDRTTVHTVHVLFHEPEHMLYACPCLGVFPVDGLLSFADFPSSDIALDNPVLHVVFPQHMFHPLADICDVGVEFLPCIVFIHELFCGLRVVHRSIHGYALFDELAFGVFLRMDFVAIVLLTTFLRPARIRVFVTLFVGLALPLALRVFFFRIFKSNFVMIFTCNYLYFN